MLNSVKSVAGFVERSIGVRRVPALCFSLILCLSAVLFIVILPLSLYMHYLGHFFNNVFLPVWLTLAIVAMAICASMRKD